MEKAILEANKSAEIGEIPVGALIIYNNKVIAKAHNRTFIDNDPTSHAEINAIKNASNQLQNCRLVGTTLIVTLEPCAMCYGAIVQARISKVIFGAYDSKTGMCGSCFNLKEVPCFNHQPETIGGVLEARCANQLRSFFKDKRS